MRVLQPIHTFTHLSDFTNNPKHFTANQKTARSKSKRLVAGCSHCFSVLTKISFLWYPINKAYGVIYIIPFFCVFGFILFWSFLSSETIYNKYGYSGLRTELKEMNRIKKAFRLSRMLS